MMYLFEDLYVESPSGVVPENVCGDKACHSSANNGYLLA